MVTLGFVPQGSYQGTWEQDAVISANGGTHYQSGTLTDFEKAIVLYYFPDTVFPDRDVDTFPQIQPVSNSLEHKLSDH